MNYSKKLEFCVARIAVERNILATTCYTLSILRGILLIKKTEKENLEEVRESALVGRVEQERIRYSSRKCSALLRRGETSRRKLSGAVNRKREP